MKATKEELQKIKVAATLDGTLDEYVYLCEDEQGMYVKYAFKEGAPHDNRCLSWYDSYQENAYIRNGWFSSCTDEEREKHLEIIKKKRMERVGHWHTMMNLLFQQTIFARSENLPDVVWILIVSIGLIKNP